MDRARRELLYALRGILCDLDSPFAYRHEIGLNSLLEMQLSQKNSQDFTAFGGVCANHHPLVSLVRILQNSPSRRIRNLCLLSIEGLAVLDPGGVSREVARLPGTIPVLLRNADAQSIDTLAVLLRTGIAARSVMGRCHGVEALVALLKLRTSSDTLRRACVEALYLCADDETYGYPGGDSNLGLKPAVEREIGVKTTQSLLETVSFDGYSDLANAGSAVAVPPGVAFLPTIDKLLLGR